MINKYKVIHFIGIGGIGVSALARLSKLKGVKVSGSDIRESAITNTLKYLGSTIHIGHDKHNVPLDVDLIVHTEDVNPTSAGYVELVEGQSRGIKILKYSQALGLFVEGYYGIGVSGTNGKSTTTAILGLIMEKAGTDPMVVIGSRLAPANESEQFKGNARFGQGKYFIYEADEYHRHMLDIKPKATVITNIEADHLDYYKDLAEIKEAFTTYISSIPPDGLLVYNLDDKNAAEICFNANCRKITFSMFDKSADYVATNIEVVNRRQEFSIISHGKDLGRFILNIPGDYNIMNALGAIAAALEFGTDLEVVRKVLGEFVGIWRRFETVGKFKGKPVISDYAHHPTGLSGLIKAAKQFYPNKKVLLVFQPHQKQRTQLMFNEFISSMQEADELIIPEIYSVPGREKDTWEISSKDIVAALGKSGVKSEYAVDLIEAEKLINLKADSIDVFVLAGAGTIDQLARKLAGYLYD